MPALTDREHFEAALGFATQHAEKMLPDCEISPSPALLAYRIKQLQSDLDQLKADQEQREWQAKRQQRLAAQQRQQRRKLLPQWKGLYRPLKPTPKRP